MNTLSLTLVLTIAMLLMVSSTARALAIILMVIMGSICGITILGAAYLVWHCYSIWSRYQSQLTIEEEVRRWGAACGNHVYRTTAFNPPPKPQVLHSQPESKRVSPPLMTLLFTSALFVGFHLGLNT